MRRLATVEDIGLHQQLRGHRRSRPPDAPGDPAGAPHRPDARVLVTGCAAELDPATFDDMPEVDRVVGNDNKIGALQNNIAKMSQVVPARFLGHVRSFVAIQNGCDHRCTFCSIWQARGPSRSLPFEAIRDAVTRELERGAVEIALTGVDITSYDRDGMGLGALCQRLLKDVPALTASGCRRSIASR